MYVNASALRRLFPLLCPRKFVWEKLIARNAAQLLVQRAEKIGHNVRRIIRSIVQGNEVLWKRVYLAGNARFVDDRIMSSKLQLD